VLFLNKLVLAKRSSFHYSIRPIYHLAQDISYDSFSEYAICPVVIDEATEMVKAVK
jgi:hypothetical protein